jgi:hypothetical protein
LHVASTHLPFVHLPLAGSTQSMLLVQVFCAGHAAHDPPQSTSLSEPFFTPSLHVASAHLPPLHLPLAGSTQSAFGPQF